MPTKTPAKRTAPEKASKKPLKSTSTPAPTTLDYFGLPEHYASHEHAQVVIIPCPYEGSTTYGRGAKNGPAAIADASQHVEHFDDELWTETYKIGIHTHKEVKLPTVAGDTPHPFQEIYQAVKPIVEFGKFPVVIGGERSVSLGAVRACAERYPDLSVLQVGAHADFRKSYEGNPYSHATVSYQIYKRALAKPLITQVGVRNISAEEVAWMEREKPNINIYWARQQERWNFQDIVATLSSNVYLNIDVNALDDSIMPATGTPEPGGMTWYQLTELIKVLCIKKNVVAADITELAPIKGFPAPDFLCAKLLYKIIGYRFALDLGVTKKYL